MRTRIRNLGTAVNAVIARRARAGADEAHLMIIGRNPERAWDEKIWRRDESLGGFAVTIWGA